MYRRILVPLDGTSCSEAALPHAQALADKFGSELILLRVVEPAGYLPGPPADGGLWLAGASVAPDVEEAREDAAESYIEAVSESVSDRLRGSNLVVTEVEWGGAVDQIAHSATEHQADLIVMGTHGRAGLERLLLGSTSESLLHHTDVPLLLVKQPG